MMFNFWKKKKNYPDFWKNYLALFENELDKNTSIDQLKFVVFDTETSGFDTKQDKLLTIGAVRLNANKMDLNDSFEVRILQQDHYKTDAIPIHGIVPNKEKGIPKKEAIQQFIKYVGDDIIVGQNIGFDIAMINQGLQPLTNDTLKNKFLDTAKLAVRVEHGRPTQILKPTDFTLDALCNRYQIPMHDRHTAAGDALLTAILFLKLISKLKKRGVRTAKDLF